jgi:hypothetical protein
MPVHLSTRTLLAALVSIVLIGLAVSGVVSVRRAGTAPAIAVSGGCPRHVREVALFGPARMVPVVKAIKAQVPRVFANLTSMGHPAWRLAQVQALVRLNQLPLGGQEGSSFLPPVQGLTRYETLAARACGRTTALASVLVFLQFPECQLPCSFGWAYVTPTRAGWHLWTSYQV